MPYYYTDTAYLLLVVPAFIFSLWAQYKVNSTFARYAKVRGSRGLTGAETARRILDYNGLRDVAIEHVRGNLTDHYDPRARVVRLSDSVYNSQSIAAVGIAAHEVGHAVQHAKAYGPLRLRNAIIPVTNIGSTLAIPMIFLGLMIDAFSLSILGVILFSTVALFQLITLPVEFNASRRAIETLEHQGILYEDELRGTRKVLSAAALTYVAALAVALAQLLRLLPLVLGGRRRD